jgi:hypothetical protein
MLVRAGAFVIVTSRFPKDTAARLALEPDYAQWRDRIHIYGLDLRVLAGMYTPFFWSISLSQWRRKRC